MEFTFPAVMVRVVDGDTLVCSLDLGLRVCMTARCRLLDVDAPELTRPGEYERATAAKVFVESLCPSGQVGRFVSRTLDKYGRPLGHYYLPDGRNLSTLLVEAGHSKTSPRAVIS